MRSIKNSIQLHQSLKKQSSSRKKLSSNTYRLHPNSTSTLTKSTHKLLSTKDVKFNNFFDKQFRQIKIPKTARTSTKKRAPKNVQRNQKEQLLMKKSDKMKLVFWNQEPSLEGLKPIVISADFVVNQDFFWQKQDPKVPSDTAKPNRTEAPPQIVKQWRQLHKNYFVIWVVRSRNAWLRVQTNITSYNLPVHAIFLVKKKRNYTVDYSPVVREIEKYQKKGREMLENMTERQRGYQDNQGGLYIFETVKVNLKDLAVYNSYAGKVPIVIGYRAKVVLMRMEADPPGLQCIQKSMQKWKKPQSALQFSSNGHGQHYSFGTCRMLKLNSARKRITQIFPCFSIKSFIEKYLKRQQQEMYQEQQMKEKPKEEDWFYDEQTIDAVIDEMKRKIIGDVINSQGRGYQFQGGLSIYNFIGQMFKRNHKILFDTRVDSMYALTKVKQESKQKQPYFEGNGLKDVDLRVDYFELEWR